MTLELATVTNEERGGVRAIAATRFGSYTLVAKLGQGAMAEVFLALRSGQGGFRKLVVIKRLHPHLLEEKGVRDMFMDEARLAALLTHPHVVQTNEVGEIDGIPFMCMEYLDGQPLSQLLSRCAESGIPLPPPLTARIISDALEGLHYAHEIHDLHGEPLDVVHRDVSPHNLFVCYEGTAKVLDFGVAKAALQVAHTEIGAIKGKYAYLAPEQAEQTAVDARTDVWSMGVVLWECLTGRRLFKRDTEMATLKAVTEGEIPAAHQVAIDAPAALSDIAARALARDPADRYPSAQAMRDDLEAYLRDISQPVRRRDVQELARALFRQDIQDRRAVISACVRGEATDISEQLALGETSQPSFSATGTRVHAPPPPGRGSSTLLVAAVAVAGLAMVALVVVLVWRPGAQQPLSAPEPLATPSFVPTNERSPSEAVPSEATPSEAVPIEAVPSAQPAARVADEGPAPTEEEHPAPPRPSEPPARARADRADRAARRTAARAETHETGAAVAQTGTLFLDTTPWSSVWLGGRSLGDTPLLGVELPAGRHVLSLRNPDQGIQQSYVVVIEPGQATRRRVGLQ